MKLLGTLIVTKVKIEKGSIDTRRSDRLYQHPLLVLAKEEIIRRKTVSSSLRKT